MTPPSRADESDQPSGFELVYVGLGCNLGNRVENLLSAITAIEQLPECTSLECSHFYETEPMGPSDQPDYVNGVCRFYTSLDAHALLARLQTIEEQHGRVRTGPRWGPRTLDLDILLYGQQQISTDALQVPHPGIALRSFVVMPMADLDATLYVPGLGVVTELLDHCSQFGIRRLQLNS